MTSLERGILKQNKFIDVENRLVVVRGMEGVKWVKAVKSYKPSVTK